ncbi:MAG: DUF2304 domain-containing protein [Culicoidibacterales bacterium]
MTVVLQVVLIVLCIGLLCLILHQISRSRVIFSDFNYWLIFIFSLLILAIFPGIATKIAQLIGVQTVVVAVFLAVIFFLILLTLSAFFRISILNRRFIQLTQKIAIMEEKIETDIKDTKK